MNNYLTPSPISIHFSVDSPSGSPFERVQSHLQVQLQKEDASNKEVVENRETTISTVETHVDVALETKPKTEPIVEQNNTIVDKIPIQNAVCVIMISVHFILKHIVITIYVSNVFYSYQNQNVPCVEAHFQDYCKSYYH